MEFLRIEEILCCIARGRYTKIITISGKEYLINRVLKETENYLACNDFCHTHKS